MALNTYTTTTENGAHYSAAEIIAAAGATAAAKAARAATPIAEDAETVADVRKAVADALKVLGRETRRAYRARIITLATTDGAIEAMTRAEASALLGYVYGSFATRGLVR